MVANYYVSSLQKDKLSKTRKSQASDFKKTWELWMPFSPECCSCVCTPVHGVQKKSNSVDIKTSENISLGLIPGPSPWARTNLSWCNHWCCAGPFSDINSRGEPAWAELCLSWHFICPAWQLLGKVMVSHVVAEAGWVQSTGRVESILQYSSVWVEADCLLFPHQQGAG